MKLSTRSRYALRVMIDIAQHEKERPVDVRSICERQELSPKYTEQLMRGLKAAGLVKAKRGQRGGYHLSRSADRISAYDVVLAMEKTLTIVRCYRRGKMCHRNATCPTAGLWREIEDALAKILKKYSLRALVNRQRSLFGGAAKRG